MSQKAERPDCDDKDALMEAIYEGNEQIVEALISNGAEVNFQYSDGYFPIHKAVINNQLTIVDILLRKGANIEAECETFSETPICYAIRSGSTEMVETLLRNGAKIDRANRRTGIYPIENAILCNNKEILEILLKTKLNLNQSLFKTLLHETVFGGNVELVEMLIDYGLEVNSHFSRTGGTLIHFAINHIQNGFSALHVAVKREQHSIIEILLKNGAKVDLRNGDNRTSLHMAIRLD